MAWAMPGQAQVTLINLLSLHVHQHCSSHDFVPHTWAFSGADWAVIHLLLKRPAFC